MINFIEKECINFIFFFKKQKKINLKIIFFLENNRDLTLAESLENILKDFKLPDDSEF